MPSNAISQGLGWNAGPEQKRHTYIFVYRQPEPFDTAVELSRHRPAHLLRSVIHGYII